MKVEKESTRREVWISKDNIVVSEERVCTRTYNEEFNIDFEFFRNDYDVNSSLDNGKVIDIIF